MEAQRRKIDRAQHGGPSLCLDCHRLIDYGCADVFIAHIKPQFPLSLRDDFRLLGLRIPFLQFGKFRSRPALAEPILVIDRVLHDILYLVIPRGIVGKPGAAAHTAALELQRIFGQHAVSVELTPIIGRDGVDDVNTVLVSHDRIGCDRKPGICVRYPDWIADLIDDLGLLGTKHCRKCVACKARVGRARAYGQHSGRRERGHNPASERPAMLAGRLAGLLRLHQMIDHTRFLFVGKMQMIQHISILLVHRSSLPISV